MTKKNEDLSGLSSGHKGYVQRIIGELRSEFQVLTKDIKDFHKKYYTPSKNGDLTLEQKISKAAIFMEADLREIDKKKEKIESAYFRIVEGTESEDSIITQLEEYGETYSELKSQFETIRNQIEALREGIEGSEEKGLKGDKGRIKEVLEDLKSNEQEWNDKYYSLYNKIGDLLPGGMSAGLASAYIKQGEHYIGPQQKWSGIFMWTIGLMIAYALLTSGVLDWIFYYVVSLFKEGIDSPEHTTISSIESAIVSIIIRVPVIGPLIWLAWFANKQQSQAKRLEQEYAYKATLAQTYEGYRKQIEALNESDERERLRVALIGVMLNDAQDNPSKTLDSSSHSEKPFDLKELLGNILGALIPGK